MLSLEDVQSIACEPYTRFEIELNLSVREAFTIGTDISLLKQKNLLFLKNQIRKKDSDF